MGLGSGLFHFQALFYCLLVFLALGHVRSHFTSLPGELKIKRYGVLSAIQASEN